MAYQITSAAVRHLPAAARRSYASECTPNIETVIVDDVDLELLKRQRQTGTVLNWLDRRTDLYEVRERQ